MLSRICSTSLSALFVVLCLPTFAQTFSSPQETVAAPTQPASTAPAASENFYERMADRTTAIQAKQPGWAVPVFSPYPMLIQVFRADFDRQIAPARSSTWNYGSSKGLNLIPFANTEFDVYYPPYIQHNTAAKDGFGDMAFVGKYRIATGNAQHGNYLLSALVIATVPTGSYKNGSADATVNPTLAGGKGFGRFDLQTTLGATLPTGDTTKLGRPVLWNATAQYHLGKYLWPEIGSNATFYHGGANDGKVQEFVTPGLVFSKYKFRQHDAKSRLGLAAGAGEQIATSGFHTYNHQLVLTTRFLF